MTLTYFGLWSAQWMDAICSAVQFCISKHLLFLLAVFRFSTGSRYTRDNTQMKFHKSSVQWKLNERNERKNENRESQSPVALLNSALFCMRRSSVIHFVVPCTIIKVFFHIVISKWISFMDNLIQIIKLWKKNNNNNRQTVQT